MKNCSSSCLITLLILSYLAYEIQGRTDKLDCYKLLKVDRKANAAQIKKAFRTLARKYHPDKVPEEEKEKAEKTFQKLATCYETLSDPEKRKVYDVTGEDPRKSGGGGGGTDFNFDNFDFGDIFSNFADFGFGGGQEQQQRRRGGGFDDFGFGGGDFFNFGGGNGGRSGGRQQRQQQRQQQQQRQPEKKEPKILKVTIDDLMNAPTFVKDDAKNRIRLPIGSYDGKIIEDKGQDYKIEIKPHKKYSVRKRYDLEYKHPITLTEALTGVNTYIPTFDGRRVKFETKKIISPTSYKKFGGSGLPKPNGEKGDLIVFFDIQFPKTISSNQRTMVKNIQFSYQDLKTEL